MLHHVNCSVDAADAKYEVFVVDYYVKRAQWFLIVDFFDKVALIQSWP